MLGRKVWDATEMALESLEDPDKARQVIDMKAEIQETAAEVVEHLAMRLVSQDGKRALLFRIETQIVEVLQREYYFAKKIAKDVVAERAASLENPVSEESLETK